MLVFCEFKAGDVSVADVTSVVVVPVPVVADPVPVVVVPVPVVVVVPVPVVVELAVAVDVGGVSPAAAPLAVAIDVISVCKLPIDTVDVASALGSDGFATSSLFDVLAEPITTLDTCVVIIPVAVETPDVVVLTV